VGNLARDHEPRSALLADKPGRRDEARHNARRIYNWFTEGFDTADLKTPRRCWMS